jgi:succinate-acetate transporter protein
VYKIEIILLIIVCGLFYGGPYSLMSTAIPITLGNQEEVKQYKNGRSAIISLVEGYGLFFSGISLILIPAFGISNIHIVGACYCSIAAFLLLGEIYRTRDRST